MTNWTGGCQCGAVSYQLTCKKLVAYVCHCLECQKQSASAFAISAPAWADALEATGPLKAYERATDSGSRTNCWFCSECGTRLYHQSKRAAEIVTIKGGTFDNGVTLVPVAHLWVLRKQSWVVLPHGAAIFETQPDDLKAWRNQLLSSAA